MSRVDAFRAAVRRHRLVAILRNVETSRLEPLVETLTTSGVTLLEIALSDEAAAHQIAVARSASPRDVWIGAGTVTTVQRAEAAVDHGAEFVVTPNVEETVLDFAESQDLGSICGAMTPTEICRARDLGATFIKLFPASILGPQYVSALLGPMPDLELLAVGGISSANLGDYLRAGALGAGVGGGLVASGGGNLAAARDEAERLTELLAS